MKEEILKLRKEGNTISEIVRKLGCAKSTISYHINNNGLGYDKKLSRGKIEAIRQYYITHTIKETIEKFNVSSTSIKRYCDNKRIFYTIEERKKKSVIAVSKRRRKIKELAVEYKGGCCQKCGYKKCIGALEFHHLDPNEKDFSLSVKGHCISLERVKKELDKCVLVCANCHREIHEEERNKGW